MNSEVILIYALKSTVVAAILYAYYLLALRDNKFHYYNRFYLLGSLGLSLIIPLLDLNWFTYEKQITESSNLELIKFITESNTKVVESQFGWTDGLLLVIGLIGFAFLAMLVFSIQKIYSIKRKSPIKYLDGIDFIETEAENAPFSFLNNLFWKNNMSLEDDKGQKIFKHEVTHIKQLHSWDRLFCQVLSSILWINPFNWIIQKELQTIHEFIADEEAMGENNTEAFAKLLLETHYGTHFLNPIHSFNYSSIKRRLTMLTKSNKTKYSYVRRVMALPIMLLALAIFSIKVNAVNRIQNLENKIEEAFIEIQVDTMKEKASREKKAVIIEKLKGEKEEKKIVIVNGVATISDLNVGDIESIRLISKEGRNLENEAMVNKGYKLDPEAYKSKELVVKGYKNSQATVVKGFQMIEGVKIDTIKNNDILIITTKSKNGEGKSIFMADPIDKNENKKLLFQSKSDEVKKLKEEVARLKAENLRIQSEFKADKQDTKLSGAKEDIKDAVYVIDSKIVESSAFKNLNPNDIQSVNVLKGEGAEKKYGTLKGNGVIEVITKKDKTEKPTTKLSGSKDNINDAVYVIDGKIVDSTAFKNLNPNDIQSVNVLKGESAEKKYGNLKGKGVIEIVLKKK